MVATLLRGHQSFRREYVAGARTLLERLASDGQSPDALFVGCSDSRVVPELLTTSSPGDIFVVRNVANLVPEMAHADASVGAAIEYAVGILKVPHIIVCGHTRCGGIKAALEFDPHETHLPQLGEWLASASVRIALSDPALDTDARWDRAAQENVVQQLANLTTFPVVRQALDEGKLALHGWVYDIIANHLHVWDVTVERFVDADAVLAADAADAVA